ncbi:class I SAM-dependent methyltransferase [Streptomyces capparidis]
MGALRDTVRQELVARQLAAHLPRDTSLDVLDAGCGQGTQALRLARAGHRVTGMDPDPGMLQAASATLGAEAPEVRARVRLIRGDGREVGRHFGPGSFDVVLCHGVLMYLEEPDPMLAALARVLRPGGLLSLLVRNGDALAMRPGLAGDWAGALAAFGTDLYTNRLGLTARADRRETLTRTLREIGVPLREWYGVRVFTDNAPDGAPLPETPAELAALLAAEDEAGRRDPYRAVAALLHLCGVRG